MRVFGAPLGAVILFVALAPAGAEPLWTDGTQDPIAGPSSPLTFGAFSELAARAAPAVVSIETESAVRRSPLDHPFLSRRGGPVRVGAGSGFIIRADGYVLSNNHVVEGARLIKVHLRDGRVFGASLVGRDPATDVSLLKLQLKGERLPTVPLGDSDALRIGEWVVAIGNPLGLSHTVTAGIVSAKGRREVRPDGRLRYPDFIQTDASINPGNSGGPLFNVRGEVIGINTAVSAQGQGIGFAIPINMVKTILPGLAAEGRVTRSWLGVQIQELTPRLVRAFALDSARGALVTHVVRGGPAAEAGIREGDVIVSFGAKRLQRHDDLPWLASTAGVGKRVAVTLIRGGRRQRVRVHLGRLPEPGVRPPVSQRRKVPSKRPVLGLQLADASRRERARLGFDGGVEVLSVDPGSVGARAGLKPGDLLLQLNGSACRDSGDVAKRLAALGKGKLVRLLVDRPEGRVFLAFTR